MKAWRYGGIAFVSFALLVFHPSFAQSQNPSPPPFHVVMSTVPFDSIAVPYDPEEPVSGGAQQVQTAEERAAAIELLAKGRQLSNVRRYPYLLKTTFMSYGSQSSDGTWSLEDTAPGQQIYRWTAQGPSFSGTFLYRDELLSSDRAGGDIPLRLAEVRNAMWSVYYPGFGPHAALFLADGNIAGGGVRCVLILRGVVHNDRPLPTNRALNEEEYCFNPQSGLLASYSPVPGYYVRYDYSSALHFHDTITIPDGFTIYEAGKTIVEAHTISVGDPASVNDAIFDGTGLQPVGTGSVTDPPARISSMVFNNAEAAGATPQVVVVAAMLTSKGVVQEHEILVTTNESADALAVDHLAKSGIAQMKSQVQQQPGTVPRAQEVIFTIEIVPPPQLQCANGSVVANPKACFPQAPQ
jgi:hypothetical protein